MSNVIDFEKDFDKIYVSYYPRLIRFAREYVVLEEDAENIVQDIFLFLWEKRDVLNIEVSLMSYMFSLVKHRCLDYLRHNNVVEDYKKEFNLKLSALEQLDSSVSSDDNIEDAINNAINKLPERCREIFLKCKMEGKKYREIAGEMNLSVNTIENQMSIALKKLRIELKDYLPLLVFIIGSYYDSHS